MTKLPKSMQDDARSKGYKVTKRLQAIFDRHQIKQRTRNTKIEINQPRIPGEPVRYIKLTPEEWSLYSAALHTRFCQFISKKDAEDYVYCEKLIAKLGIYYELLEGLQPITPETAARFRHE